MRVVAAIAVVVLAQGVVGCNKGGLISGPSESEIVSLAVNAVVPKTGPIGTTVRISGVGFSSGATVTLGGEAATNVIVVSTTLITATTPDDGAGTVDVVVTNPSGRIAMLAGGYTYEVITLTVSAAEVAPGDQLSVSWVAPSGRSGGDWIGLFKAGDPSTNYESGWWQYTNDAPSGTLTLSAPTLLGQYEFRYLLDDGFIDAARTAVTVRAGGGVRSNSE